jgi:hypothetical protein
MNADIQGALDQINRVWRYFEHRGKSMTKPEVTAVLKYGLKKGYENTGQITDQEVDEIIRKMKPCTISNTSNIQTSLL